MDPLTRRWVYREEETSPNRVEIFCPGRRVPPDSEPRPRRRPRAGPQSVGVRARPPRRAPGPGPAWQSRWVSRTPGIIIMMMVRRRESEPRLSRPCSESHLEPCQGSRCGFPLQNFQMITASLGEHLDRQRFLLWNSAAEFPPDDLFREIFVTPSAISYCLLLWLCF